MAAHCNCALQINLTAAAIPALEAYSCLRRALKHKYIESQERPFTKREPPLYILRGADANRGYLANLARRRRARRVKFPARCLPSLFGLSAGACLLALSPVCVCANVSEREMTKANPTAQLLVATRVNEGRVLNSWAPAASTGIGRVCGQVSLNANLIKDLIMIGANVCQRTQRFDESGRRQRNQFA
jgi:hypothetical protein